MNSVGNPVVSFVVPTLNRKGYVSRAVRSCLGQQTHSVDVEVVVLDSLSDDGSWEELTSEFAHDVRVKLIQNDRDRGPTASWLDGAAHATGDAVTFVWSDDYIFPQFASTLLPPILAGASVAFGHGLIRDVDTDSYPPERAAAMTLLDARRACLAFLRGTDAELGDLPVSPACALFSASAFKTWTESVGFLCRSSSVASHFLWKRAIGPDLLLFLIACSARGPAGTAATFDVPVCQFSSHAGSITIASPRWSVDVGYWLARTIWYTSTWADRVLDEEATMEIAPWLLALGLALVIRTPREGVGTISQPRLVVSLLARIEASLRHNRPKPVALASGLLRIMGEQAVKRFRVVRGAPA